MFEHYFSESSFDEVFDAAKNTRESWRGIIQDLNQAGLEVLKDKQSEIDWHLEDNGVTYNSYDSNDEKINRSWSLDPIPFVIDEKEWEVIEKGLAQRAKILNLIFRDLYSDQKLISENIVPAEVVFGHKGFSPEVYDFGIKENFNLTFHATNIARGPNGKMWVINDKTQAASGLGYAIENRLTMNIIAKELYPNIEVKKLSPFIGEYKNLIKKMTGGDMSKAAFLTPGPHNETYFEHAYLSSFLEIHLLQGNDLLSKDGALWMKSLSGLKKINTLVRRVDDRYCDPLELRDDSHLGVAGFVESMRQDNVSVINPVGSAILENVGLNPFMEKISEFFLGEKLILPQIATWWCGQQKELDFVLENLEKLVIKKIDRTDKIKAYFGNRMSKEECDALRLLLIQNPHQYAAQEEIGFSTVPSYSEGKIEPRKSVIRTFCLQNSEEYTVMKGGLVRVAGIKDSLLVSAQKGGTSKDLWILGADAHQSVNLTRHMHYVDTSIDNISTHKAENLFWLGRNLARSISMTRLIVHIIKTITSVYRYEVATSKQSLDIMQNALTHMSMTYPGFLDEKNQETLRKFPMKEVISVVKDTHRSGSLAFTISMLSNTNINLKDLLAQESWKLFDKLQKEWHGFLQNPRDSNMRVSSELDNLLIYLMAYKELVNESIFKEQGLILYDIGYKIESALLLISKARSMLCVKLEKSAEYDVLEGFLSSLESFNVYRANYKSSLTSKNVVSFLVLNKQFPKSLAYITQELLAEFKELPKSQADLTLYEKPLHEATQLLESMEVETMMQLPEDQVIYMELDKALTELSRLYLECSDEFTKTYFSHYGE